MKITFEVGDIVEVEDNCEAGDLASETVRLLSPIGSDKWEAITYSALNGNYQRKGIVETIYLHP